MHAYQTMIVEETKLIRVKFASVKRMLELKFLALALLPSLILSTKG